MFNYWWIQRSSKEAQEPNFQSTHKYLKMLALTNFNLAQNYAIEQGKGYAYVYIFILMVLSYHELWTTIKLLWLSRKLIFTTELDFSPKRRKNWQKNCYFQKFHFRRSFVKLIQTLLDTVTNDNFSKSLFTKECHKDINYK